MNINNDVSSLSFLHIHLLEKVLDKQHITNRLTKNHFNKSILINENENYISLIRNALQRFFHIL